MSIKITGFNAIEKKLKRLEQNIEHLKNKTWKIVPNEGETSCHVEDPNGNRLKSFPNKHAAEAYINEQIEDEMMKGVGLR